MHIMRLSHEVSHTDFDIDKIINSADRKLVFPDNLT